MRFSGVRINLNKGLVIILEIWDEDISLKYNVEGTDIGEFFIIIYVSEWVDN